MTYDVANHFWDLDNEYVDLKLQDFAKVVGAKHKPSVQAFKGIAPYLGSRQRKRKDYELETTNETKAQLYEKTGWSIGTVSDVIKFLEWMGLIETIRRGGGKNKLPTVRHLITTGRPTLFQSKRRGIISIHNGISKKHKGIEDDHNGKLPDTPKDIPIERAHDIYVHESLTKEKKRSKEEETHIDREQKLESFLPVCDEETGETYLDPLSLLDRADPFDREPALFAESLEEGVLEALGEFSHTPDDVKNLMAGWE